MFRSAIGKTGALADKPINWVEPRVIRRRTVEAGFTIKLGCLVFRAIGITAYHRGRRRHRDDTWQLGCGLKPGGTYVT